MPNNEIPHNNYFSFKSRGRRRNNTQQNARYILYKYVIIDQVSSINIIIIFGKLYTSIPKIWATTLENIELCEKCVFALFVSASAILA
jgi:hypothetical protein